VAIGDLLQPSTLAEALVGVDAVVHLAAFFRGAPDAEARAVNEGGAIAMAEAAIKAGISRFVFVSTNLAYGPGRNRPAREDDDLRPTHTYPITKAAAEQALRDLHCKRGFGPRTLRLAFVYGEGDPHISELMPALRTWNPAKRIQGLMGVRQVSG
jgi:nucleoside-diphosphate-sugar epimerase